ncbi:MULTISPECIES: sporulation histidine kinase inhibitor Sda [Paenibacillus]|uniref:sporulation histidine kinase inhibitor Sda n=1 Tax=Paenibacillus TaxID=44249 RepID=UPI0022B889A1|nr:sporulation histidine kinase inhibitor Sda [Paenibacillus caseinilyticus]MCZ8522414.1 sporulation histidine kinase inhibitor Sda [Paenibacillus caseinilyticus]
MNVIDGADRTTGLEQASTDVLAAAYQKAIALGLSREFILLLEKELLRRASERRGS